MTSLGLIPARGGSKGIPRKNIKLFNNKPLIYWSIKTALESAYIDKVVVSTDDEEIADIARSLSAEVPFFRPRELSEDNSLGIDTVLHALENLNNINDVLLLQPTSPLRRTLDIDEIFKIRSEYNSESAVSLTLANKHIDLFFKMNSRKIISPFSISQKMLPRQQYPDYFTLNGALYLSTRESIFRNRSFITSSTVGYIMPQEFSIDIDTPFDWEIAEDRKSVV